MYTMLSGLPHQQIFLLGGGPVSRQTDNENDRRQVKRKYYFRHPVMSLKSLAMLNHARNFRLYTPKRTAYNQTE